jgi:hypothetical protein
MQVEHSDVRILREALAYCGNYGTSTVKSRAIKALGEYAKKVGGYCKHPDKVTLLHFEVCLDCGHRVAARENIVADAIVDVKG